MAVILVVDDEPEMLLGLVSLLEMKNHTVLSAKNGLIGLSLAQKHQPALIISDLRMPKMNGIALLEALQTDEVLRLIPFILLSAFAAEADAQETLALGAQEILDKPIQVDDFYVIVAKYV